MTVGVTWSSGTSWLCDHTPVWRREGRLECPHIRRYLGGFCCVLFQFEELQLLREFWFGSQWLPRKSGYFFQIAGELEYVKPSVSLHLCHLLLRWFLFLFYRECEPGREVFLFFVFVNFERECTQVGERQRKGEGENPQQVCCQCRAWCWARTHKPWDHELRWRQMLNRLSHAGAPWERES